MLQGNWAATLVDAARIHNEKEEWKNRAEFYHSAFDAATKTIDDMRKSREEQFKHLRQDISIREWISQHDQQGTVPTEEFVEFLQSLEVVHALAKKILRGSVTSHAVYVREPLVQVIQYLHQHCLPARQSVTVFEKDPMHATARTACYGIYVGLYVLRAPYLEPGMFVGTAEGAPVV